jgi:hypothetical protein
MKYLLTPSATAALIEVEPQDGSGKLSAIYMGKERGVVIGIGAKPLDQSGLPLEVRAAINRHFGVVFSIQHETWKGRGPSPRADYVGRVEPWVVDSSET